MLATQQKSSVALRSLLAELIDYAGLFPPAGLPMATAVRNYAAYRNSDDAWALGRFVVPVAQFAQFIAAFEGLENQAGVWPIAALLGADWEADFEATAKFGAKLQDCAAVDVVEAKTAGVADIERLVELLPANTTAYCEIDPAKRQILMPAIKQSGLRAKIRTGGLTEAAFPPAEQIADFLLACAAVKLPFKVTAGLHHPVRCERALTYEANSPRGTMHGFLNVFLAAAMAWSGMGARQQLLALLNEPEPGNFTITDDALAWRGMRFSQEMLRETRRDFAISFGSCSFEEPLADLRELRLL